LQNNSPKKKPEKKVSYQVLQCQKNQADMFAGFIKNKKVVN